MPPIPDKVRKAILQDIRQGNLSRAAIARKHGTSASSIGNIARKAGLNDAFAARTVTENATRAAAIDRKAHRSAIADMLVEDVYKLRERAWSKHTVVTNGPDGPETVELPLPPPRETQALYTSIGIALQRHLELENFDRETGDAGAKNMLAALMQGLGHAYDKLTTEKTPEAAA